MRDRGIYENPDVAALIRATTHPGWSQKRPNGTLSLQKGRGISMPLTAGQIVGHDSERLAFAFTMMNGDEAVPCQISDAAMDELAGTKGTPSIARQAQFVAHREAIERIASDLYDEAPRFKGYVVRIFTKHIQGR